MTQLQDKKALFLRRFHEGDLCIIAVVNGRVVGFYEMSYERAPVIWGATAGMVINLYRRLTADAPPGG